MNEVSEDILNLPKQRSEKVISWFIDSDKVFSPKNCQVQVRK